LSAYHSDTQVRFTALAVTPQQLRNR